MFVGGLVAWWWLVVGFKKAGVMATRIFLILYDVVGGCVP